MNVEEIRAEAESIEDEINVARAGVKGYGHSAPDLLRTCAANAEAEGVGEARGAFEWWAGHAEKLLAETDTAGGVR